jgi:hypothetical protein
MRKLMLVMLLALAGSAAGLFSAPEVKADDCVTYCMSPNACGYICCYERCCNGRCVNLDCAPPPPCGDEN